MFICCFRGHKGSVWCLEMLGNFMFSSGSDKLIKIWDLSDITKGCTKTLTGHDHTVRTWGKLLEIQNN